jgi:hypothetical protein
VALERTLRTRTQAEVRFDTVSRALYATDASVYQIMPLGVVVPRSREDFLQVLRVCLELRCPMTMRGGGTSQAGQAIGAGVVIDISKYVNAMLELNVAERWVRVEPGIVLDELNARCVPHGLRFAPDVSTASRATIGGMMANNSSGARSVSVRQDDRPRARPRGRCSLTVPSPSCGPCRTRTRDGWPAAKRSRRLLPFGARARAQHRDEIERRYPKVLRRVGGYNLDEFVDQARPFNLAKMMVGPRAPWARCSRRRSTWCRCRVTSRCWPSSSRRCPTR